MSVTYNQYIEDINLYFSSIAQNKIRTFHNPDKVYDAADLKAQIASNTPPHFATVAAYELARGLERSHDMRIRTPKDYYASCNSTLKGRQRHFDVSAKNYEAIKRTDL